MRSRKTALKSIASHLCYLNDEPAATKFQQLLRENNQATDLIPLMPQRQQLGEVFGRNYRLRH